MRVPEPHEEEIRLGPCCMCERSDRIVRNIVMLPVRAPIAGRGWGCFQCDLPQDGAVAVLCDPCLQLHAATGETPKYACRGFPKEDGRILVSELAGPFDHDMSKHPECTASPA